MKFNPDIHHRRSLRLEFFDYSSEGMYFVTICVFQRQCLFGDIDKGKLMLNQYGDIAREEWLKTMNMRNYVDIDEFVIMPNHIYGIIGINKNVGAYGNTPLQKKTFRSPAVNLGSIIRGYKAAVTKRINTLRNGFDPVWQSNYYEHIIHNENELLKIREYIQGNPFDWLSDDYFA